MSDPTTYDPGAALALCQACNASYTYPLQSTVWSEAAKLGLQAITFSAGPIAGYLGTDGDRRVLVFEGTHSIAGWLDDFNFPLVRHPSYPGKVHCGFAQALDSVWGQIISRLSRSDPTKPLDVTGHSLGAALATLAQWRLVVSGVPVRNCYTFGTPRVGDADWQDANALAHWRVVDDCDPICRVPFAPPYHHVGRMAWYDRNDRLCLDPSIWQRVANWVEEDLLRFAGGPWQLRVAQLAHEHMTDAYLAALTPKTAKAA